MFALSQSVSPSLADGLPEGFVYLSEVDPTIVQDIRYATSNNFTGAPVPGYRVAECVLRVESARALKEVQADLRARGYGLKVFDCYRPIKAVRWFAEWATRGGPPNPGYYPAIPRSKLVGSGYVARVSGHSTGGSVDLTMVQLDHPAKTEVDMGTGFDFFDSKSHVSSAKVTPEARRLRQILSKAMSRRGFKPYWREWWHFTYSRPSQTAGSDFNIERSR